MPSYGGNPTQPGEALAHYGRIFKTLHVLSNLDQAPYRAQIKGMRNLQEGRHDLARHIFHGRRGDLRRAYHEGMEDQLGDRELIVTIPGISTGVADVIIAETGADMSRFPTAGHLASWAGTCPGSNESAGRIKSSSTRPGNPYLKGALGIAAMSAARSHDTYLAAKHRRIASRRGPVKAVVAIEHTILISIWNMLTNGVFYDDLGGDYYSRLNPERTKQRALNQLRAMGFITGRLAGRRVNCLSVEQPVLFNGGCVPRDMDLADTSLLRQTHFSRCFQKVTIAPS